MYTEYSTDQILETYYLDNDHCDDFFEALAEARQALQGFDLYDCLNLEESYV